MSGAFEFSWVHSYYDNPFMGDSWVTHTGLNEWAETNDIIIIFHRLYPQRLILKGAGISGGLLGVISRTSLDYRCKRPMLWLRIHLMLIRRNH